ncbi:hypothetical protein ACGFNU_21405 [Spirillospora sp. NPDC048911]|uniref:hypothetical protein n=1 Tax=Spirillospora sp. NPDC048911 TaxID=3364527 RepID=UPI003715673A
MSFSMFWRPAPKDIPPGQWLDDDLKYKLGQRLWESGTSKNGPEQVGAELVPYLEGLADGGVVGAKELIEAIREHERVEIWIGDPSD